MKILLLGLLITIPTWANASPVILDWEMVTNDVSGVPLTDLAGYKIYQATTSFKRAGVWVSTTQAQGMPSIKQYDVQGQTATFAVGALVPATPYFFRATAYTPSAQSGFNTDAIGNDVEVSTVTAAVSVATGCDINGDGQVSVVDVQRVINSALGGACVTTP